MKAKILKEKKCFHLELTTKTLDFETGKAYKKIYCSNCYKITYEI